MSAVAAEGRRPGQAVRCRAPQGCARRTTNPDGLCHFHAHLGTVQTPAGSVALRGRGVTALPARLARERETSVPADSAGIAGWPYATRADVERFREYLRTRDPGLRPPASVALDRFPLVAPERRGGDLTGAEVAVVDAAGEPHALAIDDDGQHVVVDQALGADGVVTRVLAVEYGPPVAVRDDETYQVVEIDVAAFTASPDWSRQAR